MHKEVHDCLLCGSPLAEQVSWLTFLQTFAPTTCAACEEKFETVGGNGSLYRYGFLYGNRKRQHSHVSAAGICAGGNVHFDAYGDQLRR